MIISLPVSSVAPLSPKDGQIWHDSSSNTTKVYLGSKWVAASVIDPVDAFDPSMTPRVLALEIQQQLLDKHDIESELTLDPHDRPIVTFNFRSKKFIAAVGYPQINLPGEPAAAPGVKNVYLSVMSSASANVLFSGIVGKSVDCLSIKQLLAEVERD
jgi:hypothetical protein